MKKHDLSNDTDGHTGVVHHMHETEVQKAVGDSVTLAVLSPDDSQIGVS